MTDPNQIIDPVAGSGAKDTLPSAQGTTSNVELSFDYLRTADVIQLSTSVKLKFPTGATLPDMLWEVAWKLIRHHVFGKWLK